jgi:glucose/mannose transport system substrate-binding protein
MKFSRFKLAAFAFPGLLTAASAAEMPKVEVLHFWTSGSEAAGLSVLKDILSKEGVQWTDSPVAGGTGANMMQVLRSRIAAGNAPSAVQLHAQQVQAWGGEGVLVNLNRLADKEHWDKILSPALIPYITVDKNYVAVPVNIHRNNWLWYNKKVFDKAGVKAPTSWEEFNTVADKLLASGVTPLALGGQNWQETDLFENIVLGIGGKDFYKQALIDQKEDALRSPTMVKVFGELRHLNKYVDPNFPGRDWNLATAMVIKGEAAMQIQGDWAKGELAIAKQQPNVDYGCAPTPGTAGDFLWLTDNFGFFTNKDPAVQAGQLAMASAVLSKEFQEAFGPKKGSIPVRVDVSTDNLDYCGQQAFKDLAEANKSGMSLPSLSHDAATAAAKSGVFLDVVSSFFENKSMTTKAAIDQLVSGLQNVQ